MIIKNMQDKAIKVLRLQPCIGELFIRELSSRPVPGNSRMLSPSAGHQDSARGGKSNS